MAARILKYADKTAPAVLLAHHTLNRGHHFRDLLPSTAAIIDGNEGTVRHLGVVLESLGKLAPEAASGSIELDNSSSEPRIDALAHALLAA